jgi:hypothetical protein
MSFLGGWFGLGGGRPDGGGSSRHQGSGAGKDEEKRRKHIRSDAAKKQAAKCYTNYGQRLPPSLAPYTNYGEGSSASSSRPCSSSPLSDEDAFKPEANAPAEKVFGPDDFVNDDETERCTMELALHE